MLLMSICFIYLFISLFIFYIYAYIYITITQYHNTSGHLTFLSFVYIFLYLI